MPIYEYEPLDHECLICDGRIEVMQPITAEALERCPTCGLGVRRVISKASIQIAPSTTPEKAAARGFTTYKKAGKGNYERIAGDGPEGIVDPNPGKTEAPAKKKINLD